jgi:hypothetical protein
VSLFRSTGRAPSPGRLVVWLAGVGAVALIAVAIGCGDPPSTPMRPSSATPGRAAYTLSTNSLTPAIGLLRTQPLLNNVVVVKVLSNGGGGIDVPGTDFQLQVPNGAFSAKTMTFTITAYAGNTVAYDFQPHGFVFLKPLQAVQQLGHTNWKTLNLPPGYYPNWAGGYFADPSQINMTTGQALINEFMPGGISVGGATMTWSIPHFSGYMVSTGRAGE